MRTGLLLRQHVFTVTRFPWQRWTKPSYTTDRAAIREAVNSIGPPSGPGWCKSTGPVLSVNGFDPCFQISTVQTRWRLQVVLLFAFPSFSFRHSKKFLFSSLVTSHSWQDKHEETVKLFTLRIWISDVVRGCLSCNALCYFVLFSYVFIVFKLKVLVE